MSLRYHAAKCLALLPLLGMSGCVTDDYDPNTSGRTTNAGGGGAGASSKGGATNGGAPGKATCDINTDVPLIVVDQFGYLPDSEKIAVIRDPDTGFDATTDFAPGGTYALVDAKSGEQVFTASPTPWNEGGVHAASGDRAYWFDFSEITTSGTYYVLDVDKDKRSHEFVIGKDVYRVVLRHALRTFFYQRVGQEKVEPYADKAWVDSASHVGKLQDHVARRYDAKSDVSTERDLWGGWYDAGDYNKYTSWTANYIHEMLQGYEENPAAFTDDFGIPESGNGVPDILDEARFGLEYLARLQNDDGSLISVVGESSASPPSAAKGQTVYGSPNTSGTLAAAAAFAAAARIFTDVTEGDFNAVASQFATRATRAFTWAEQNPAVTFRNNDSASGTSGLAAGQQEVGNSGRAAYRIKAAVALFRLTGESQYASIVDANYSQFQLIRSTFAYPFEVDRQDTLLSYADAPGATATVRDDIRTKYRTSVMTGSENLPAHTDSRDPYLAYLKDYVWGSNSTKSNQGNLFWSMVVHGIEPAEDATMKRVAERYLHYLHGLNPFGLVYLSNMKEAGAENSVATFYHSWFSESSPVFSCVSTTTPGPAPGFLVGGPNPQYAIDACCPDSCGSSQNNDRCDTQNLTPPLGQPALKSYRQFNGNWPQNSWSVSENSDGYQIAYIRLLSKYVR